MIKFLHMFGVILFLGNIIISALWRLSAEQDKGFSLKRALSLLVLTDWVFTLPGVILIGVTGHMLAPKFGGIAANPWIYHSYAMLTVSAVIWLAGLLPIQIKQRKLLEADEKANESPKFKKLTLIWTILACLATLLPLIALYMMVSRPV